MSKSSRRLQLVPIVFGFFLLSCGGGAFDGLDGSKDAYGNEVAGGADAALTKVVLGRGYDITGRYAYSPEIKEAVLDHNKLMAAEKILKDSNLAEANFTTTSGSTITEYQSELAVSASASSSIGILGASFSSEVGAHFNQTKFESDEYAFATSTSKITKTSFYIDGRRTPAKLIPYLSDGFISDLATMKGPDLFAAYGTHVMLGGIWGARLDYHLTAKKKTSKSGTEIGAYAQAKVEAAFGPVSAGGGASTSVDTKYSNMFDTTGVETTTNAYGGSPEYARSVHDKGDYDAWVATIADNPVWCEYYPESLQPLSAFIDDPAKKAEIEAAYQEYLKGRVITVTNTEKAMTVTQPFAVQSFTNLISGGDEDINSKNGRTTEYELSIVISKLGSTNLNAEATLRVKEVAANYTELKGVTNITIPVNQNITSIDLPILSYSKTGVVEGATSGWVTLDQDCPFLSSLKVCLDGNGPDRGTVGIAGDFEIPIHYR